MQIQHWYSLLEMKWKQKEYLQFYQSTNAPSAAYLSYNHLRILSKPFAARQLLDFDFRNFSSNRFVISHRNIESQP